MEASKSKESLINYIKEEFLNDSEAKEFNENTALVSTRIMDSISTLQLVDYIEREFGIEFNHHEVDQDNLDTVNKMWDFITSKKQ